MTSSSKYSSLNSNISRRGLLQGGAALGAASMLMPLGARQAAAAPKRGGKLRLAMGHGNTTDGYDPAIWDNAYTQVFATARHANLTEVAADGQLEGELAESWDSSPDATVWTLKLREGVTFHSGKTLTADDVIASINHHRGEESQSAAKPIVAPIKEIKADGPNRVVVTLEAGNADFPFIISDYHLPIMPAVDGKIDPTSSDGCGAYVVDSYEPGVRAALTRNPNYWKAGRGHFDQVEIYSVLDSAARQNGLLTGEFDVIDRVDLNTIHLLKRRQNVEVLTTTGTQHYTFAMDTRAAPFNDNNVRMALKYGIDRQELVEKILNGYGEVGNDHPIGRSNRFFNTELAQKTYDPDQAKHYLKKAGLDSLTVDLSAADAAFTGAVDAAVLYAEKAAAAGITLNVQREPNDGYWSNVWMVKPWSAVYWGGRPTEDWMFTTAYASGAAWNDTFWENERFNKLLVDARAELNNDRRREMYWEMQDLVANQGGVLVPMFASYVMAHSDAIAHPDQVAANWTLDGFRICERWWFA